MSDFVSVLRTASLKIYGYVADETHLAISAPLVFEAFLFSLCGMVSLALAGVVIEKTRRIAQIGSTEH